ncbi:unnamed protein product [Gongylonema pulchrum]|uniref:Similar to n=1 Tax=Gongylonema pulchrum TaxID=637853 RepID=A0A183EWP3_9BILA|nr:unnamed protein product [Gongylonema pulchrum]
MPDRAAAGSNLPKNLSSAIKRAAISTARQAQPDEKSSPTGTVLHEEDETVQEGDGAARLADVEKYTALFNDNDLPEYPRNATPSLEDAGDGDVLEQLPGIIRRTPRF